MFSDVSAWFYKTLAGIRPDPDRPGFKRAVIKPCPVGDLTFAKGETRTPYGTLKTEWHREGGRFVLEVSMPPNSSATVHVPSADGWEVHEIGSGDFRFETELGSEGK
jgi:alpha-L-rhamnosidase